MKIKFFANTFKKGDIISASPDSFNNMTKYIVTRTWGGDTWWKKILRVFFIKIPINTIEIKIYE